MFFSFANTPIARYISIMKYAWKKSLAALAAITVIASVTGCGGDSDLPALFDEAEKAASAGDWKKVAAIAETLCDEAPDDPNSWIFKSLACERTGDLQAALEAAGRGAELCPGSFYAQYNYGRLLAAGRNSGREALTVLRRAFEINRSDPECLKLLIQCSGRSNADPGIYYLILSKLSPNDAAAPEVLSSMGVYMLVNGRIREGIPMMQEAYRSAPDNPVIVLNFARAVDRCAKQPAKALPLYRRYLDLAKSNPEAAAGTAEAEARIQAIGRGAD